MHNYYRLLKERFPKKTAVLTELINLEAIQHLPKGTEFFVSDLHGEYAAFDYVLRHGSGNLKVKLQEWAQEVGEENLEVDIDSLALFIYYPEKMMEKKAACLSKEQLEDLLESYIPSLIRVVKFVGSKYTRSKLRKAMQAEFAYVMEELVAEVDRREDKAGYCSSILKKIRNLGQLDELFVALANLIQHLTIDHLHVLGDIYDRGAHPDRIIERIGQMSNVDIQWGNHDITWMGAVAGSALCMINVIRIAARYNNLALLEDSYGINLRRLVDYALSYYTPLPSFAPVLDGAKVGEKEQDALNCLQQACAVLQWKLEYQCIERRPDFRMGSRQVLAHIDWEQGLLRRGNKTYVLENWNPCRIDPQNPGALMGEEEALINQLIHSFQSSERLVRHMDFLIENGSMYLTYNKQLLFHGCIPLHENGDLKSLRIEGKSYRGKELLDFYEYHVRKGYRHPERREDLSTDLFWYLWTGECSSLFGKAAMTTFERYYISDASTHREEKNPYYSLRDEEEICEMILAEFGLGPGSHIINGHTPVIESKGESPIKAGGRMLVIDGGFAKAYQKKTGNAGYTLVFNSYGFQLVAHRPFTGVEDVLAGNCDVLSTQRLVEYSDRRILVKDTSIGQRLGREIQDLEHLYLHFEEY